MTSRGPHPTRAGQSSAAETVVSGLRWWHFAMPAATVTVLGFCGFWVCEGRPETTSGLLDVLYRSLQLFVFEYGDGCSDPTWMLQVARFAAPLVPAGAIFVTLLRAFREQLRAGRMRRLRRHVVVCGLGRKGLQLVRDYCARGVAVVAIDIDGRSDNVRICADLGAFVLIGNAVDDLLLRRARVQHASRIVALSGDDGVNVEVAMRTYKIIEAAANASPERIEAFVHVIDPKLCALFRQHHVFADHNDRLSVHVINAPEQIARTLLREYPLDHGCGDASGPRAMHLVCVGFGKTGEAVVVEALRVHHGTPESQLRVTVIDLEAAGREKIFRGRYPNLAGVREVVFVQGNAADMDILQRISGIAGDEETLPTLLVTMNGDSSNLLYALQVRESVAAHRMPIFVRMDDVGGLTSLTTTEATGQGSCARIIPFGMAGQISVDNLLDAQRPE